MMTINKVNFVNLSEYNFTFALLVLSFSTYTVCDLYQSRLFHWPSACELTCGLFQYKDAVVPIEILFIKIRRSHGRLILITEITITQNPFH